MYLVNPLHGILPSGQQAFAPYVGSACKIVYREILRLCDSVRKMPATDDVDTQAGSITNGYRDLDALLSVLNELFDQNLSVLSFIPASDLLRLCVFVCQVLINCFLMQTLPFLKTYLQDEQTPSNIDAIAQAVRLFGNLAYRQPSILLNASSNETDVFFKCAMATVMRTSDSSVLEGSVIWALGAQSAHFFLARVCARALLTFMFRQDRSVLSEPDR